MITVGDAKQDWGFLQHVEAKQIPLHGLLQTETDLGFATEGGHFCHVLIWGRWKYKDEIVEILMIFNQEVCYD